jgi:hypothetical protein
VGEFMKKIILAGIMLLSNVAFASTKTADANSTKTESVFTVHQQNVIHVDITDPD